MAVSAHYPKVLCQRWNVRRGYAAWLWICGVVAAGCIPQENPESSASATETTEATSETTGTSTGGSTVVDGTSDIETITEDPTTGPNSSGGGSIGCICTPGEASGQCLGLGVEVCAPDCTSVVAEPCPGATTCHEGACVDTCVPGSTICLDVHNMAICDDDGLNYGAPRPCDATHACQGDWCPDLCSIAADNGDSVGCEFVGLPLDNFDANEDDVIHISNPSDLHTAHVEVGYIPVGSDAPLNNGPTLTVSPGEHVTWSIEGDVIDGASRLRQGGVFRLRSNVPVTVAMHGPGQADGSNDASLVLPKHSHGTRHVVASYPDSDGSHPGYFTVIALADDTQVSWKPPVATAAGVGVSASGPGETQMTQLDRYGVLQIQATGAGDLTGALIDSNKPIAVFAGAECVNIPAALDYCDHLQEQMLPVKMWSNEIIAVHAPVRGTESFHYRVLAAEDQTVIHTAPPLPGTPAVLDRGEWFSWVSKAGETVHLTSEEPILAVQYLEGGDQVGLGDPAMVQVIAPEHFARSYDFVTPSSYSHQYAQLLRPHGAPNVWVDDVLVAPWTPVAGGYEVAQLAVAPGSHRATSSTSFGLSVFGYGEAASYAFPGGYSGAGL